jgi:hypothetical protein
VLEWVIGLGSEFLIALSEQGFKVWNKVLFAQIGEPLAYQD